MIKKSIEFINAIIINLKMKKKCKSFKLARKTLPLSVDLDFSPNSDVMIEGLIVRSGSCIRVRNKAKLTLMNGVALNNNCVVTCRKNIVIGENTNIGPNCCIFDHDHDYKAKDRLNNYVEEEIYIGSNVWIGANVTILKGTKIGDNCVIGAGSVVKGVFNTNTLIAGSPAKAIKNI